MFAILGKREGLPLLRFQKFYYIHRNLRRCLVIPAVQTVEKCTSLKTATHHMKRRRTAETRKFQRSIHKMFFNIMYTAWSAVRFLSRHYELTAMGYKYLEIGSNAGSPSYVEIVLGDHRGHELSLSLETWKGLYEQHNGIFIRCCETNTRIIL